LPLFLKLTNTHPFAAWFVVTRDATPDGIRVMWSVLGAISSLPRKARAGAEEVLREIQAHLQVLTSPIDGKGANRLMLGLKRGCDDSGLKAGCLGACHDAAQVFEVAVIS